MNYCSRYFIVQEGLFKNKQKIISVFYNCFTLENSDGSDKETVNFEDILSIHFPMQNEREFMIEYQNRINKILVSFSCITRVNLLSDLLAQIDMYSKINIFPIETFQCFIVYNYYDENCWKNKNFIIDEKDENLIKLQESLNSKNIAEINLNLYRSIFEWIEFKTKKPTTFHFHELESLKQIQFNNVNAILVSTVHKIELVFIPKKQDELNLIIEKIVENSNEFIGYAIKLENNDAQIDTFSKDSVDENKTLPQNTTDIYNIHDESSTFICERDDIYRIISTDIKIKIEFLWEGNSVYEICPLTKKKLVKIPIEQILYIVLYEETENYFEIILNDNSRLIFETDPMKKNTILTKLIELIHIKKNENDFLILSSKPKLGKRVRGFINNIPDYDYECGLFGVLSKASTSEAIKSTLEDIALNMCYRHDTIQKREAMYNLYKKRETFDKILNEMEKAIAVLENKKTEEKRGELYRLNLILLFCRSIGWGIYDEKFKALLIKSLDLNYFSLFYNTISILKNFLLQGYQPKANKTNSPRFLHKYPVYKSKKEENLLKTEILKSIITTKFFRRFTYKRIYENGKQIKNFEQRNILFLSMILHLQIYILYTISSELPIFQPIITELTVFESIFLLYKLTRCESNILKHRSIQILLILMKNLTIEQKYQMKTKILNQTVLFFNILLIYLQKEPYTVKLALSFLKNLLISHVENTNLILNLFPMTLFHQVEKKPNPINWQKKEWDNFFGAVLEEHSEIKLIWNKECRKELTDNLLILISSFEHFTENNSVVLSFSENFFDEYLPTQNNDTNEKNDENMFSPEQNISHYSLNYKEIKIEYKTLKKEAFVWEYYLRKIIDEKGTPTLCCQIEKPKKFWKKLKKEIFQTNSDEHLIMIIKTMTLLYNTYYESIGPFDEYELFIKVYKSVTSFEIKTSIIQLLLRSINLPNKESKEQNMKNLTSMKGLDLFIELAKDICKSGAMKSLKNKSLDINIETIEKIKASSFFIDNKNKIINNYLSQSDYVPISDETFPNYSGYMNIDDISWKEAMKEVKVITLIILLYKLLLRRNPIILLGDMENTFKIQYPIPKMKSFFCEEVNFEIVLNMLLYNNENLIQETIDFFISYLDDPLTYYHIGKKYCLVDILFILMIKYKSKGLMDLIDKIYNYEQVFFGFDAFEFTEEEKEFFNTYKKANKFLCRFIPINVIYFKITHDFNEFIELLFAYNIQKDNLIWNREMLNKMINDIKENIINNPKLLYDKDFKCDYTQLKNDNEGWFLYYLNLFNDTSNIKEEHCNSMIILLNDKKGEIKYLSLIYKILKKNFNKINKQCKGICYDVAKMQYDKYIIENEKSNYNDDINYDILLLDIKILYLIGQENNQDDIVIDFIKGIEFFLGNKDIVLSNVDKELKKMIYYINLHKYFIKEPTSLKKIFTLFSFKIKDKLESNDLMLELMKLCLSTSSDDSTREILLNSALLFQFILICFNYNETNSNAANQSNILTLHSMSSETVSVNLIAFQILKRLSKSQKFIQIFNHLLGNTLFNNLLSCPDNSYDFLIKLKDEHITPVFIWNQSIIEEVKNFLNIIIDDIHNNTFDDSKIYSFKCKSCENELKINNVYLSIYNKHPTFKITEQNQLLTALLNEFNISQNDKRTEEEKKEILTAIANSIEYSNADISILCDNSDFINSFKNFSLNPNLSSPFTCLNMINVLTLNELSFNIVLKKSMIFCLINLIEKDSSIKFIDKLKSFFITVYEKRQEKLEKINLSPFLFLLKKLLAIKSNIATTDEEENTSIRMMLISVISLYINNFSIGIKIQNLYKKYLPEKIIDIIFIQENNKDTSILKYVDNEIELPELIWNAKGQLKSVTILESDCKIILSDINNIENFNNKMILNKKKFEFKMENEYTIDNVYLRIFNKEPNYNIEVDLINFLNDVINDFVDTLEKYIILLYEDEDNNYLHYKVITAMTTIMLIIEQINFNIFNQNLQIKNVNLYKIPIDSQYLKLLNESICNKIMKLQKVFFEIIVIDNKEVKQVNSKIPNDIHLIYMQIMYLINLNKFSNPQFNMLFSTNVIDFYITNYEKVSTYELIVLSCILNRIFSNEASFIEKFLIKYVDSFFEIMTKRLDSKIYIEMIISQILADSKHSESLKSHINNHPKKDSLTFEKDYNYYQKELFPIWRKGPESKDNKNINKIYKNEEHYYDEFLINNNIDIKPSDSEIQIFIAKYPIIPNNAISYLNIQEINIEELEKKKEEIINKLTNNQSEINKNEKPMILDILKELSEIKETNSHLNQ